MVFSKRCFWEWHVQRWSGSARAGGTNMLENTSVFRALKGFASVVREKTQIGKHHLEPLGIRQMLLD